MTVTPRGHQDVTPAAAVVSFIAPTRPFDFDVIERFWHQVLYFASRLSVDRWAAWRGSIVVLPAAEAFEVGVRAWSKFRPLTNTDSQAR